MRVVQGLQCSTEEGPEQPEFDPLKANDSSFDFAIIMGHKGPYGTTSPDAF